MNTTTTTTATRRFLSATAQQQQQVQHPLSTAGLQRLKIAYDHCAEQARAYGQCMEKNFEAAHKGMCTAEFDAFRSCYRVCAHVQRIWIGNVCSFCRLHCDPTSRLKYTT